MPDFFECFSIYGIESEYMIVDINTLKALPISDKILREINQSGHIINQVSIGHLAWSNELVKHVIELKCEPPFNDYHRKDGIYSFAIKALNKVLLKHDATLMPTAMHPWFIPSEDTVLWNHGNMEIYQTYDEIFSCQGHGWSNLQSIHINLPYKNESEFLKLHAAIRLVLPLIPLFSAASPFVEGKTTKFLCNRLEFYEKNQAKVPSITGKVIPPHMESIKDYDAMLEKMYHSIKNFPNGDILCESWLNSHGCIAKFDVQAIEIRLMDTQESSYMDYALIDLFICIIQKLYSHPDLLNLSKSFDTDTLYRVYKEHNKGDLANELSYYQLFVPSLNKVNDETATIILDQWMPVVDTYYHHGLKVIKEKGCLAKRLIKDGCSTQTYRKLIQCLASNKAYE